MHGPTIKDQIWISMTMNNNYYKWINVMMLLVHEPIQISISTRIVRIAPQYY